jgi:tetratricopeptide (TPR) repeat protein
MILLLAGSLAGACGDQAHREYLTALRGDESGMTRQEQIAHVTRAIELHPERTEYWETRAIYEIDARDFDRARSDLDRVIQYADRPYARFLRGMVSCQMGDLARSLGDFDLAIAGQPENSQFYRGRSLARSGLGNPEGGLEDAEHLVALSPQVASSYYARGVALAGLGRGREALRDFDEALRRQPELVYPMYARADVLERLDRYDESVSIREAAKRRQLEQSNCALCLDPFRY